MKTCCVCGRDFEPIWKERKCRGCDDRYPMKTSSTTAGGRPREIDPADCAGGSLWVERKFESARRRQQAARRSAQTDAAWWQL